MLNPASIQFTWHNDNSLRFTLIQRVAGQKIILTERKQHRETNPIAPSPLPQTRFISFSRCVVSPKTQIRWAYPNITLCVTPNSDCQGGHPLCQFRTRDLYSLLFAMSVKQEVLVSWDRDRKWEEVWVVLLRNHPQQDCQERNRR